MNVLSVRNTKTIQGTINEVRKEEEEDTMRQKMDKVENKRVQLHRSGISCRVEEDRMSLKSLKKKSGKMHSKI